MKYSVFLASLLILHPACLSHAGTLNKGNWTSSDCGSKPSPPLIDGRNAEVFNQSVAAVNDWQQEARIYYGCLVKEANNDNAAIAKSVNQELDAHKKLVDQIAVKGITARRRLER